jgi:hypothetical protein
MAIITAAVPSPKGECVTARGARTLGGNRTGAPRSQHPPRLAVAAYVGLYNHAGPGREAAGRVMT